MSIGVLFATDTLYGGQLHGGYETPAASWTAAGFCSISWARRRFILP